MTQSGLKIQFNQVKRPSSDFALELNVQLEPSGVTALFGPSGSGKTTLLRCIAGLQPNIQGHLEYAGQTWQDDQTFLPTHQRPIGFVFQDTSLFPHLTVQQNLHFAIKRAKQKKQRFDYQDVLSLMNLKPLLERYPNQISGGEAQRVAIARAMLSQPSILLMDEPLSALDNRLKQDILPYLEKVCLATDIPILYVSHSLDEVSRLANHILVIEQGKLVESGKASDLLSQLDSSFANHQDASVLISGKVIEQNADWQLSTIRLGRQSIVFAQGDEVLGETVRLRIQARDVSLSLTHSDQSSILNRLSAVIDDLQQEANNPSMTQVRLLIDDTPIVSRITSFSAQKLGLSIGMSVIAQIKSVALCR
ncbi:molybdenum ABC transporter ATP-binding protein [Marinomonas posidonica]|uniref:molybdenum ABC transporter ATP-binding protein n=1 Tax=Marinomonas posidonica TaxID=936476 RepID=UPI0037356A6E